MVSALHKELEYKMEKLKHKKVGGQRAQDQNQIRISSRNCKPSRISSHEVLQSWLINTV